MPTSVNIQEFLKLSEIHPVVDVRSPGEFDYGHIPNAHSLPLFTDEERAVIGTAYKQINRETAVNKGLEFFGPKMKQYVKDAKKIGNGNTFLVHCWRGGMRSASMAWLLELYGYKIYLLQGGYKSFRRVALECFDEPREMLVLGGRTGSAKTLILKELAKSGEQVIDLEGLAHHKGSAFGGLGEKPQPSQEMFENELFFQLLKTDKTKTVWIEDESIMIGMRVVPKSLFEQIRTGRIIFLDIPFHVRSEYLTAEYGKFEATDLKSAITRIQKKLGGVGAKTALEAIDNGNMKEAFEICLMYYDKTYTYGKDKRVPESIITCSFEDLNVEIIAQELLKYSAMERR